MAIDKERRSKMNVNWLSKEEAIEIGKSGVWKEWDATKKVLVQLFNDLMCIPISEYQNALNEVLGRLVLTHELAYPDMLRDEYLTLRPPPTMQEIIDLMPGDRPLIVVECHEDDVPHVFMEAFEDSSEDKEG
jgi:hypothetical protein